MNSKMQEFKKRVESLKENSLYDRDTIEDLLWFIECGTIRDCKTLTHWFFNKYFLHTIYVITFRTLNKLVLIACEVFGKDNLKM